MVTDNKKSERERQIDANLRRIYSDVVQEDIPDRFKALLDQLREREEGSVPAPRKDEDK